MSVRRKVLEFATAALKGGIRIAGGRSAEVSAYLSENLAPVLEEGTGFGTLKFLCPGVIPEYRARTLLTKEPETIEWIGGFNATDVFWDVGANVGAYSLYAALKGLRVCAFEPSPGNYYLLSRNVELNGFAERVSSMCIAFNDETRLDYFYMANTEIGAALNSFGEAVDWKGEKYIAKFKQSMLGFTIDDFVAQFSPPFPNHLKIDVDGIEKKIIKGASRMLRDARLKSVLMELNINLHEEYKEVGDLMAAAGLKLHKRARAEALENTPYGAAYNHIFMRS